MDTVNVINKVTIKYRPPNCLPYPVGHISLTGMTPGNSKPDKLTKSRRKPLNNQRTYRFNTELFESFEEDCSRHLANPKLILVALIPHWLDTEPQARDGFAMRHRKRFGASSQDL